MRPMKSILCINSGGLGDLHGIRMRKLEHGLDADLTFFDFDKSRSRWSNAVALRELLGSKKWDLVYQEATGIAAGVRLIIAAMRRGQRYVVSSGDPVSGFFVCGIVGSLTWNARQNYCYGLELVESLKHVQRDDVSVLIVGDGEGRRILEERIPERLKGRIVLSGRVPPSEVGRLLRAMDIGIIPQALDHLGSYRLTTKLPEYLAAGLAVAMSPIPVFYDYVHSAGWPLPARHPASEAFHVGFGRWMDKLDPLEVRIKAARARAIAEARFSYDHLTDRFAAFIGDLMYDSEADDRVGIVHGSELDSP